MLVIRTSKLGTIGNSKPCYHCVQILKNKLPLKGYALHKIYYSESDGSIVESTIKDLESEPQHISLFYRQKNNLRIK